MLTESVISTKFVEYLIFKRILIKPYKKYRCCLTILFIDT